MTSILRFLMIAATMAILSNLVGTTALAQGPANIRELRAMDIDQKRDWMRERLTVGVRDARVIANIRDRLGRLNARELDRLIDAYLRQLALAQANLQRALLARQRLQQQLNGGFGGGGFGGHGFGGFGNNVIGYAPVITWLPTGTSLGVSGIVSPDRRSVRIGAQPFFSHVPYFDTFNLRTGQTRRYPVNAQRSARSTGRVQTWYDGMRTRTGPRVPRQKPRFSR